MSTPTESGPTDTPLVDDRYVVEQAYLTEDYTAKNSNDTVVVQGERSSFISRGPREFYDGDGNELFSLDSRIDGWVTTSPTDAVVDARTGEDIVLIEREGGFRVLESAPYNIRAPEDEQLLAKIEPEGIIANVRDSHPALVGMLPHRYEITDADGGHVGSIEAQLSLRDRYEITIDDASAVPKRAIIIAAMVIDAFENT